MWPLDHPFSEKSILLRRTIKVVDPLDRWVNDLIFCAQYAFCRMPRSTTLPYRDRMLGTMAFRAALMMGAILLVGGIAFLMFFDGDVFTASIFSFLPAAIVSWFGLAVRTFFVKD